MFKFNVGDRVETRSGFTGNVTSSAFAPACGYDMCRECGTVEMCWVSVDGYSPTGELFQFRYEASSLTRIAPRIDVKIEAIPKPDNQRKI